MPVQSYQELVAWQKGVEFVAEIYRSTRVFPKEELYGLTNQFRRAAVSIPSNIAEGQGRLTRGEFKQFLGHARGSFFEVESQLVMARMLGYLSNPDAESLLKRVEELGRILNGLLNSLDRKLSTIH
jgi:four helix bundle protein